jgi:hypothetical protein
MQEGTARILGAADAGAGVGAASSSTAALVDEPSVATAWCGLQFVAQALKGSEGMGGPFLAPHLLGFLPSLLKLQARSFTTLGRILIGSQLTLFLTCLVARHCCVKLRSLHTCCKALKGFEAFHSLVSKFAR